MPDLSHAITTSLIAVEELVTSDGGWDIPPVLMLLRDRPYHLTASTETRELSVSRIPIPDHHWHAHPHGVVGVLTDIAETLHEPASQAEAILATHDEPDTRVVGWAVLYHDVLTADTTVADVRCIDAVDLDGRVYRLIRARGHAGGTVTIADSPDPDDPATCPLLAALLAATRTA
jgi:hypothetical protein